MTAGSERFKKFLAIPFKIDMLYPVFGNKSTDTLFDDWQGKVVVNWYKFTNTDEFILEFYSTYYVIKKDKGESIKYMLSIPETINDFINDMDRFNVQLYWTAWIDENFEPKEYLHKEEIKEYFANLLLKMGKSHELL